MYKRQWLGDKHNDIISRYSGKLYKRISDLTDVDFIDVTNLSGSNTIRTDRNSKPDHVLVVHIEGGLKLIPKAKEIYTKFLGLSLTEEEFLNRDIFNVCVSRGRSKEVRLKRADTIKEIRIPETNIIFRDDVHDIRDRIIIFIGWEDFEKISINQANCFTSQSVRMLGFVGKSSVYPTAVRRIRANSYLTKHDRAAIAFFYQSGVEGDLFPVQFFSYFDE